MDSSRHFFEKQGLTVDRGRTDDKYVDGKVFLNNISVEGSVLSPKLGSHEAGALQFAIEFMNTTCHYLNLDNWWYYPTVQDIEGF